MMIKLDPITERSVMKSTAVHTQMIGLFEMHKEKFDVFKKSFFLGSIGTVWFSSC